MKLRKVVLDTNVYIDWLNHGFHESWMLGPGLVRYLSAVVLMELRVGAKTLPARRALDKLFRAYESSNRVLVPTADNFDQAGRVLRELGQSGLEIRRSSLVSDTVIALSTRALGATLITKDADFESIRRFCDFKCEQISD